MEAKARILLAEHHSDSRAVLSSVLKSAGYLVEEIDTAAEFHAATRRNHHDLILLDENLPDLDCLDACRRLKECSALRACQGPSVIVLSSAGVKAEPDTGPADRFISRAVGDKELIATVDSMIRLRGRDNTQATNDLYRQMVDRLHQGIWAIDRDGYTTFMNRRMADMLMTTPESSLGRHLFDFMDERGIGTCRKYLEQGRRGLPGDHEFDFLRADGSRIHTIMQTSLVTNPAGEYIGALAGVFDITARVRAENANIQRVTGQFRQLLEAAPDAVVVADGQGKITLVNACTEKLFGYTRGELLGLDTEFLIPEEHRGTHRQLRGRFAEDFDPRITGEGYELSGLKKDGSVFPAEVSLSPLHTEGGLQFVSTIRDISRRKNFERHLQANLNAQKVIGTILHLSLEPISLVDFLQQTLEMILDLPWLSLLRKGAIFLVEGDPDVLVMKARVQLPEAVLTMGSPDPFGKVDRRQETVQEAMDPDGHCHIPIMTDDHLFGVIKLFLQEGHTPDRSENNFLTLVADALAGTISRKQAEENLKVNESQLLAAQSIQKHILPGEPPTLPGFQIAGAYRPAEFAAGDHYDHFIMPDGSLGFGIGDVSGHGFSSALIMASTHAYIHSLTGMGFDLCQIFRQANINLNRETDVGQFVTAIMGRIDPTTGELTYVSAGHPTGYVIDRTGDIKASLTSTGIPLAVLEDGDYPLGLPVQLETGDVVVLLTDGVLEAMSPDDEFFGDDRTLEVVRANQERTAGEIVEAILREVAEFSGNSGQDDDITAVVIKVVDPE